MSHAYDLLTPDTILNAIDTILVPQGKFTSGHQLALNSYENRVYQIGIEEEGDEQPSSVIAKFYRPQRWSDECILQEHQFTLEAKEDELPVIAPLVIDGKTLFESHGFRFALFPKQGGQSGQIENLPDFEQMGRLLGRLHQTANCMESDQRPVMTPTTFAQDSRSYLLENNFLDPEFVPAYESVSKDLCDVLQERWDTYAPSLKLVHGDLHAGNLIWYQQQPYMLDLDDCSLAPRIQDIWMLLHGERDQMQAQLAAVARGYELFLPFPAHELPLIEVLRSMRLMHYSGWLAKRWEDPAFKMAFPWFGSPRYWSEQILNLREQLAALQEPHLQLID
mgnify:FL=1